MSQSVIIALISMIGTILGAGIGVAASAKLTQFRLKNLEQRETLLAQLNNRVTVAEQAIIDVKRRIKALETETGKLRDLFEAKC